MALRCYQLGFENPWLKQATFHQQVPEAPKDQKLAESFKESLNPGKENQDKLNQQAEIIVKGLVDEMLKSGKFEDNPALALTQLQQLVNAYAILDKKLKDNEINRDLYHQEEATILDEFKDLNLPIDARESIALLTRQIDQQLTLLETHSQPTRLAASTDTSRIGHPALISRDPLSTSRPEVDSSLSIAPPRVASGSPRPIAFGGDQPAPQIPEVKPTTESVPTRYDALLSAKATLPDHFRGEDSYEQIENMKYLQYGEKLYDAIQTLADARTKGGIDTDNRTMWESLRGGIIGGGGRFEVNLNEIVRAEYAPLPKEARQNPAQWILDQYKGATGTKKIELEKFLRAAQDLLTYLPKADTTEVSAKSAREETDKNLPEEMKASSSFTDTYLFDRDSYGPPVRMSVFKNISYALDKKDRPVITEDNWMDEVGTYRKPGEVKNTGEVEIISEHRAYEKLMETGSAEKYLAALNKYMETGKEEINALLAMQGKKTIEPAPLTLADITNNTKPSADQVEAIHHGMMLEAAQEMHLYQEQNQKAPDTTGKLSGAAAAGAFVDTAAPEKVAASGSVGMGMDLGKGQSANLSLEGTQIVNAQNGNLGRRTLGPSVGYHEEDRNGRFATGVDASVSADLIHGDVGADAELYGKEDIDKKGTASVKEGGEVSLSTRGVYAGVELGVDRNVDKSYEARLSRFKEKNADAIANLKKSVNAAIDAQNVPDSAARKAAAEAYIDLIVQKAVLKNFTKMPLQFAGAGVKAGVGVSLPSGTFGLVVGPFAKLAIVRPVTKFRKEGNPETTPGATDPATVEDTSWIPEGTAVTQNIDLPSEVLYNNDSDKAAAEAKAQEGLTKAYYERNDALKNYATLSAEVGDKYPTLHLKDMHGVVRLYVDPSADLEAISTPNSTQLNIGADSNLSLHIRDVNAAQGQGSYTEVYLSTNPSANPDTIKSEAAGFMTWTQDGEAEGPHSIVKTKEGTVAQIYTEQSASDLASRSLTPDSATKQMTEDAWQALSRKEATTSAGLFDEYSENSNERQFAKSVAIQLVAEGVSYNDLAYGSTSDKLGSEGQNMTDEAINAKITELFKSIDNIDNPTIDEIYMARQYAMEKTRPEAKKVPLEWNKTAFDLATSKVSQLYNDYMTQNAEAIKNGQMNGDLPSGTEFYVYVSANKDMKVLQGYYDKAANGDILAPITWNAADPDKTLDALGAEKNDANRAGVIEVAKAIQKLDWKASPFNSLPNNPTFQNAMFTTPGELLLRNAKELYGAQAANDLSDLAKGIDAQPTLKATFIKNVQELLTTGKTMVNGTPVLMEAQTHSGLYGKCMNLVLGRSFVLKYETPPSKQVQIVADRQKVETGMTPLNALATTTVNVGIGLPSFSRSPQTVIDNPAEAGSDTENPFKPVGAPVQGPNNYGNAPDGLPNQ